MREITIGEQKVRVRATPLALLFYKQEFKTDLLGDLIGMQEIENDPSQLDSVMLLQLIWAMAKADSLGKQFPSFYEWVGTLDSVDFTDQKFITDVMEEALEGFFRSQTKVK